VRARALIRVASYLLIAQTITQMLAALTGFLLLRWLDLGQYAEYTLAFGFGSTVSQLIDLGFTDSIVGLIGDRASDPAIVGSFIKAAFSLRWLMCVVLIPLSAIPFFLIAAGHGWPVAVQVALFGSVVVTIIARALVDYYSIPLILAQRYRQLYAAQVPVAAARLLASGALQVGRLLVGWTASMVNALGIVATALVMRKQASGLATLPKNADPGHRREVLRVITPMLPAQLFFALQGQITIFIISAFGSTDGLAQIGALARLGQGFLILGILNNYLFLPRIAQASRRQLPRRALLAISAMAALLTAICVVAFIFPELLTLLLGHRYNNLGRAASWFILSGSVATLSSTIYTMNVSRQFVWWWSSMILVLSVAATEIGAAAVLDLHSVLNLQYFSLAAAIAALLSEAMIFIYGLRRTDSGASLDGHHQAATPS
jgi:O-antigen/teichoic acid export membrane protein